MTGAYLKGWKFVALMSILFTILIAALWFGTLQLRRLREESTLNAWMTRETEMMRSALRTFDMWLNLRVEEQGISRDQAIVEFYENFLHSQRQLPGAHIWIYHGGHFVVDTPSEFPGEYLGMHLPEVFSQQKKHGASHFDAIVDSILRGGEGSDWYIWSSESGPIYITWTSQNMADGIWTIGSSTPKSEILDFTQQNLSMRIERGGAIAGTILLLLLYSFGFYTWHGHQSSLEDVTHESYENALRLVTSEERQRRYAFIINTMNEMMSLVNREYIYEMVNDAYCWNYGHPQTRIIGKHIAEVWGKENFQDHIRSHIERCYAGEDVHYETWLSFENSLEARYYEVSMFPYSAEGDQITHVVIITKDVTGEMLAERELQRSVYTILFLNRIIEAVSSTLEPDQILNQVCEELADALGVPQVSFAVLEEDRLQLRVTAEYFVEGRVSAIDALFPVEGNPKIESVITNHIPIALAEIQKEEPPSFWQDLAAWRKVESMLIVPVFVREQILGALSLESHQRREFTTDEIALALSVATVAGHALENARLYKALTIANDQLTDALGSLAFRTHLINQLHEMSDALQSCLVIQEAYPIITKYAEDIFLGTSGVIFLSQDEKISLKRVLTWGEKQLCAEEIEMAGCMAYGHSSETHPTAIISSCRHCNLGIAEVDDKPCLCLPLHALGQVLGVLFITDLPLPIIDEWQHKMYSFAERVSLSLGNLKLRHTLQTLSIQDPLTGLYNRRYLNEALAHEVQRALRHNRSFGVMMMDIDHFKKVNDTYGHDGGDEVLRHLSQYLKSNVRAEDIACRFGGEEFLIVLSETTLSESGLRAQEILEGIRILRIPFEGNMLSIRVSMGVAAFPRHGETSEAVIQAADRALMHAKRRGRDRVVIAERPEEN